LSFFDESQHVPLAIEAPKKRFSGIQPLPETIVTLLAFFPTILVFEGLLDVAQHLSFDGASIIPYMKGGSYGNHPNHAISMATICDLYGDGSQELPCVTKDRGGTSIRGVTFSLLTTKGRFNQWRELNHGRLFCRKLHSKESCESSGCFWI